MSQRHSDPLKGNDEKHLLKSEQNGNATLKRSLKSVSKNPAIGNKLQKVNEAMNGAITEYGVQAATLSQFDIDESELNVIWILYGKRNTGKSFYARYIVSRVLEYFPMGMYIYLFNHIST